MEKHELETLAKELIETWQGDMRRPENPFGSRKFAPFIRLLNKLENSLLAGLSSSGVNFFRLRHRVSGDIIFLCNGSEVEFYNEEFAREVKKILGKKGSILPPEDIALLEEYVD